MKKSVISVLKLILDIYSPGILKISVFAIYHRPFKLLL